MLFRSRAGYGYGYGGAAVGAGLAAAAIGTAAVAAAATSPWGYYGGGPYVGTGWGGGYFAASPWGDYECRNPYGYPCNPHASKNWWGTGTTGVGYYGVAPGYYGRPLARAAYYRATGY